MDENNNNFLDKNTLLAITLSILFFVGWQFYISKKYPEMNKPQDQTVEKVVDNKNSQKDLENTANTNLETATETEFQQQAIVEEKTMSIDFDNFKAELTSKGMGLNQVELKKYSDRENKNIIFGNADLKSGNFVTQFNNKPLNFNIVKKAENHYIGTAQAGTQTIQKDMIFNQDSYTIEVSVKTLSGTPNTTDLIETRLSNKALKIQASMFAPAYEGTEFFTINDGSEERERIEIETKLNNSFGKSTLASIGSLYFAVAIKDQSDVIPKTEVNYDPSNETAFASVYHSAATKGGLTNINFIGFIGPKEFDILTKLDPQFSQMINFGVFSILSKPLLNILKWLYEMFKNWGLAIIVLTIFIRILLLPINISSLRSMKKMQKIQPQLKAIKEKYKEDPQRVNQETMALMKKEKANPLGGCLPMFLQIPVFFAYYSMIGQSIELYKQPFAFWVQDLSYQDPFYVLPIAVGALYFIQMSLTPQTGMDPTQAKMMKFVPLLFCFFMVTLPSGLTLYFFVNTVFGIGQQYIFQREKRKAAA